ncbi:uncharacterized protein LOC135152262 [Daucus carota subsp. sativus]|uniref:uncharacterized protein LOC135152262 n=1 Tax=Daucus carota subsp. sativus TaxID=79200 RepID=UPI003083DF91
MVQNSVQFGSSPTEDPNMHIRDLIEIYDTFKFNGVTEDAIKLRLFPFSLRDKSRGWLHSLPAGSITTWENLAQKFLNKFFPMAKTAAIRNAITQFSQQSGETLCETWERYKEMLRKCHHHGMPDWMCAISSESAQFVSNFHRSQQPAPATYHPNNRNHPNFSWSNNQNFKQQPQQPFQQHGARRFIPSGSQ